METSAMNHRLVTIASSLPLRNFVSHYWLSLDNPDLTHAVLPDGMVDLVIKVCGATARSWVYGTTTIRTDLRLEQGSHYLGIRFKPGQSRHFVSVAAHELTDAREPSQGLLLFTLNDVPENIARGDLFLRLDKVLECHVARHQPTRARIDDVISLIEMTHGATRIHEAAALFGKSRRQFERVFLETVGVSAKFFSLITRFRHASDLLARSSASLAGIAAEAGYTDQSHMTHAFRRLASMSPAMYARSDVAFLQDRSASSRYHDHSDEPQQGDVK
ncbi:MAG: AraC family transcriptional regulator [Candidatus Manganitrophaceae bacterium]